MSRVLQLLKDLVSENDKAMPDPVFQQWMGSPMRADCLIAIKELESECPPLEVLPQG